MGPVLDLICSWAVDWGNLPISLAALCAKRHLHSRIPGAERRTQVEARVFSDEYSKDFGALQ
jgi:hypothetical protein